MGPLPRDESVDSSRDECHFPGFCHFQRDESVHSSRDKCHFRGFCPKLRDESVNSSRASRTQPISVEFRPIQRDESVDSLHALHTQHFFALLRPWSCNESADSLHRMGHFSDFCPDPCNESADSLHRMCHFSGFCPDPCNESANSLHRMGHFPDFCPDPCNESVDSLRNECHFSDYCQASIHPSSFVSAFRLSTAFAIRVWAGVIWSEEGAVAVRAGIVLASKAGPPVAEVEDFSAAEQDRGALAGTQALPTWRKKKIPPAIPSVSPITERTRSGTRSMVCGRNRRCKGKIGKS
jgi:hypothetical protein